MAHFAELDADNVVQRVIVVNNTELLDGDGNEQENLGIQFCQTLFGGTWVQTSYNGSFRKNFAAVGDTYDSGRDAFISPQPYASWTLSEETCKWQPPVAIPTSTNNERYSWNEATTSWDLIE